MPVLLDTNVVSELARPKPDPRVEQFCASVAVAYLSVVTLHELEYGARLVTAKSQAKKLRLWLNGIREHYARSILPVTVEIAETAARMRAEASRLGKTLHTEDALIAATADVHALQLATRNLRDFAETGVKLINPWSGK